MWLMGWGVAVYCMYLTIAGASSYLPVYLANGYLMLFGMALGIHRILHADRVGQPIPDGPLPTMALFFGAFLCGEVATMLAPSIGERNYCYATTMSLLTREVPHAFRCTYSPFFFMAFVAAFWVLGWAMAAIGQRRG